MIWVSWVAWGSVVHDGVVWEEEQEADKKQTHTYIRL